MTELEKILLERDGATIEEIRADIAACRAEMMDALDRGDIFGAQEIYSEWFGLEPDYIFDVVDYLP